MTLAFTYDALPGRVRFAAGALAELPSELDALGFRRAIILTTPQQADQGEALAKRLEARAAGHYAKAVMHVPIEVVDDAFIATRGCEADCLLAIGGGSTIGLAKALAMAEEGIMEDQQQWPPF